LGKKLQFGLTLTCLICVLAIFIAPSVDLPATVLQLHHTTLGAAAAAPSGSATIPVASAFAFQHHSSPWQASRSRRSLAKPLR